MSGEDDGEGSVDMRRVASSSQAVTRTLRASSSWPKRAVTAVSERGAAGGSGRARTERARVSLVNPCTLASGIASWSSLDLDRE